MKIHARDLARVSDHGYAGRAEPLIAVADDRHRKNSAVGTAAELCRFLDAEGVPYEVCEHRPAYTAAAEARVYGSPPQRAVKTVVVHTDDRLAVVAIPASERLEIESVRRLFGDPATRLATEGEIEQAFGAYETGALPPFGFCMPAPELVDRRLLAPGWVIANGGDHRHTLRVNPLVMVRLSGARVVDICTA